MNIKDVIGTSIVPKNALENARSLSKNELVTKEEMVKGSNIKSSTEGLIPLGGKRGGCLRTNR